jgi:hypothetical protein
MSIQCLCADGHRDFANIIALPLLLGVGVKASAATWRGS